MNLMNIKELAVLYSGQRDISNERVIAFALDAMNDLATKYDSAGNKKLHSYVCFSTNEEAGRFIENLPSETPPSVIEKIRELIAVVGSWSQLPEGCLSVKRCMYNTDNISFGINTMDISKIYSVLNLHVVDSNGYAGIKGEQTDDFRVENGYIRFPKTGTYTIEYVGYYGPDDFGSISV